MKTIQVEQFGGPQVLKIKEIPALMPLENQVLVKIKAIGVNPVDTYIRSGTYSIKPTLPYTPGFDAAGIIESLGAGVQHFKIGDRVYLSGSLTGTYAEFAVCDLSQIHLLPENFSFAQGAGISVPYATAYHALFNRAQIVAGETILIHGASGGVGTACVQLAKSTGCRIMATASTERGQQLVKSLGADFVENHSAPGYLEKLSEHTNGNGIEVIIEMLANKNLNNDMQLLMKKGRIVVVGNRGTVEIDPRLIMGKNASIFGMSLLTISEQEKKSIHQSLAIKFKSTLLTPVIGKEFSLDQAAQAHEAVLSPGAHGKIILIP